jgi:hypothetical protein
MNYRPQLKLWATEQALMTWRNCHQEKAMPTTDEQMQINQLGDVLYTQAYSAEQDWLDMRNKMAVMAEDIELGRLEEFQHYLASVFEARDDQAQRLAKKTLEAVGQA